MGGALMDADKLGAWSFMAGAGIAIFTSLLSLDAPLLTTALVILGFVVGFLNVSDKDTTHFLVAVIALAAAGNANVDAIPVVGATLQNVLRNVGIFVAPAAAVVALKVVYEMASGK